MKRLITTGFTLIEVLVVIAIIGILASIVIANVQPAREASKAARAQGDIRNIRTAIQLLIIDTSEWPGHKTIDDVESGASGNEIWDLTTGGTGLVATDGTYTNWNGPYIDEIPLDPWGNPYFFDTDYDIDPTAGTTWAAVVGSFGPNGVGQNVYDSDNVYLLLKEE
jgi:general secretion pathway protein G